MYDYLSSLTRNVKRTLLVLADIAAYQVALWLALALRLSDWWPSEYLAAATPLFMAGWFINLAVVVRLGLYRAIIRFMGLELLKVMALASAISAGALFLLATWFDVTPFPRSVPVIFAMALLCYFIFSRLMIQAYHQFFESQRDQKIPVLIYGANQEGVHLAEICRSGQDYAPVAFVDDNADLKRAIINGLTVYKSHQIESLLQRYQVDTVLVVESASTQSALKSVYVTLSSLSVNIKILSRHSNYFSTLDATELREVELEDLLGRDVVEPIQELLALSLKDKTVLVTGAGGSIGSELARQAILNGARALILYEHSETALYEAERMLVNLGSATPCVAILGSVLDEYRLAAVFSRYKVDTVYHAAAFKHVPIVEHNVIQGVRNNAVGAAVVARQAIAGGVSRFVFVSTDKAVRPTNVMGASKRLAELQLQRLAQTSDTTVISMVRFGNVLGSSGSVIPLFKEQIMSGGPVTVTHPEVCRYFMTISEAVSLVVQAGSIAQPGDVFLLDMGEPVKINDLAKRLIELSGYSPRSELEPNGIEIRFTGLRPGEKLYEELLVSGESEQTIHPKIWRAKEVAVPEVSFDRMFERLESALAAQDSEKVRQILIEIIDGYQPAQGNVDLVS